MRKTTAVIIDDLADARLTLKQDLSDYCPTVDLLGEADGVVNGLKLIKEKKPDIVFLDINMNDGTGFDLLEIIDEYKFKVIFTTASDSYAVKAFKFSAVDYLLKPIDIDELIKAVEKAALENLSEKEEKEKHQLLKNNLSGSHKLERIALHTQDKIHICSIHDIIRCEANVNYTMFFFVDKTKMLITKTLKSFEKMLSESGYMRVHQSHLINLAQIKEFIKTDGGYLIMNDGSSVPVATRKRTELMQVLSSLG